MFASVLSMHNVWMIAGTKPLRNGQPGHSQPWMQVKATQITDTITLSTSVTKCIVTEKDN